MNAETAFQTHRPRLMAGYRLLGSRASAEDVVQDAWLRWSGADPAGVRDEAWLVTTTTRLGLDRLRAAKRERAHASGRGWPSRWPSRWADPAPGPAQLHALADDVSVAFLTLLEQLGPEERAAFLLKEAFDHDYREIAELIGHSEANCRQMVHRARQRLQARGRASTPMPASTGSCWRASWTPRSAATARRSKPCCTPTRNWSPTVAAWLPRDPPTAGCRASVPVLGHRPPWRGASGPPGLRQWRAGDSALPGRPPALDHHHQVVDGRIANVYSVLNPEKLPDVVTRGDGRASW